MKPEASTFFRNKAKERLSRPGETDRTLFIRMADAPFDKYNRLLAYVAPNYSKDEREMMSRKERATFNLNLIESGWATPFLLYPNIPGELDLPLYKEVAVKAMEDQAGQYENELSLPGYEYRMCEKLYGISKKISEGKSLSITKKLKWRSRYCADIRNLFLYGPENYFNIPQPYRLWIWPDDIQEAISMLNLIPQE